MIDIYTIGVYNSTEVEFFNKIKSNQIELFCDIRQRRGVRGSKYKFVNSIYLQNKLKELHIEYLYIKGLAPTNEIRQKQKDADRANNETKKLRTKLGDIFIKEYESKILDIFDMTNLINEFKNKGYKKIALFCVEEHADACHRSLVARRISQITNSTIKNL